MAYVFDLGNPATNANPFPEFARLRAEDPVHWSPAMKAWIITRYADVKQVALNNKQISADRLTPFFKANPEYQKGSIESLVRYLNHWMVFRDPPDHTRLRRLFTKAFTPTFVRPSSMSTSSALPSPSSARASRGACSTPRSIWDVSSAAANCGSPPSRITCRHAPSMRGVVRPPSRRSCTSTSSRSPYPRTTAGCRQDRAQ